MACKWSWTAWSSKITNIWQKRLHAEQYQLMDIGFAPDERADSPECTLISSPSDADVPCVTAKLMAY